MSAKTWSKVSDVLSEVLTSTLKKNEAKNVMDAWNERKTVVSKLVGKTEGISRKAKKDPNAPKKASSAYILFCNANRASIKEKNPDLSASAIMTALGAAWQKISEKDKAKFSALAEKDKARYAQDMESYVPPPVTEEEETSGRKKRVKKDPTGPKRPMAAYMYYCQDARVALKEEGSTLKGGEITTEIGRRWKLLTDKQKIPYNQKHEADKARYQTEKENGVVAPPKETKSRAKASAKATPAPVEAPAKVSKAKASAKATPAPAPAPAKATKASAKATPAPAPAPAKATKASAPTKFKKTPGFDHFADEARDDVTDENPDWSSKKVDAELEKRWMGLDQTDRDAYEAEVDGSDEEAELSE